VGRRRRRRRGRGRAAAAPDARALLAAHPSDLLRHLQRRGVAPPGAFAADEDVRGLSRGGRAPRLCEARFLAAPATAFATALAASSSAFAGLVLYNLLLGAAIASIERAVALEGGRQPAAHARTVDKFEAALERLAPRRWLEGKRRWWPARLVVLRLSPERLDAAGADRVWAARGWEALDGASGGGDGGEAARELAAVRAQLVQSKWSCWRGSRAAAAREGCRI
jgi:hypothetical protein